MSAPSSELAENGRTLHGCDRLPPLLGHLVAVTGHRRVEELAAHLQTLGAAVTRGPMMQTRPIAENGRLRASTQLVIARPPEYLVATTGIGVRSWLNAAASYGGRDRLVDALRDTRILARGPKVVGALSEAGLHPWFVEPSGRTQPMIDLLHRRSLTGAHVAFQLPGSRMEEATEALRAFGAWVTPVAAYEWTWPEDLAPAKRLLRAVAERHVSAVTFTSRPAVQNFVTLARQEGIDEQVRTALQGPVASVCVGEVTADELRAAYGAAPVVPARPILGSVVQAVVESLRRVGHHHIEVPGGQIIVQRRLVVGADGSIMTSDREADVLGRLLATPNRTIHRDELLSSVWADDNVDASVLETTVARLRRRLAKSGLPVRTINGRGYLLDAAVVPCPRRCVDRHTVPLTSFGA